jgi:hypothetical protein
VSAVLLLGYNRPENIVQRIQEISANKPKHLYLSIDGAESREIRKSIKSAVETSLNEYHDPKAVSVYFRDSRLGLSRHILTAMDTVLETEDKVIVLEDDIKIGSSFVSQLTAGFNTFSDNPRFGTAGGFSGVPITFSKLNNYWRTTRYFSAWGWMTNVRNWEKYQFMLPPGDINNQLRDSKSWQDLNRRQQEVWLHRFDKVRKNPELTWDFQVQYLSFKYDLINVLPLFRICENVGFGDSRSTNTKSPKPKWMQSGIVSTSSFRGSLSTAASNLIASHIDSFAISGDSSLRQNLNWIRRTLS